MGPAGIVLGAPGRPVLGSRVPPQRTAPSLSPLLAKSQYASEASGSPALYKLPRMPRLTGRSCLRPRPSPRRPRMRLRRKPGRRPPQLNGAGILAIYGNEGRDHSREGQRGVNSPVEPRRRSRPCVNKPKCRPEGCRSRDGYRRSPASSPLPSRSLLGSDRQRTGGDRIGAGRGKGLFKPNGMPKEAATGTTGGFCGGSAGMEANCPVLEGCRLPSRGAPGATARR